MDVFTRRYCGVLLIRMVQEILFGGRVAWRRMRGTMLPLKIWQTRCIARSGKRHLFLRQTYAIPGFQQSIVVVVNTELHTYVVLCRYSKSMGMAWHGRSGRASEPNHRCGSDTISGFLLLYLSFLVLFDQYFPCSWPWCFSIYLSCAQSICSFRYDIFTHFPIFWRLDLLGTVALLQRINQDRLDGGRFPSLLQNL